MLWFEISFKTAVETKVRRGEEGIGEGGGGREEGRRGRGELIRQALLFHSLLPTRLRLISPQKPGQWVGSGSTFCVHSPQVSALSQQQPGQNCMVGPSSVPPNFQY